MSGTYNHSDGSGRPGSQKRVLIAEGDGFTRLGLILILRDSGFAVDFASNGALALRRVRARTPDALLVEIELRGLSGLELIKKARKETPFADRPVFVFTNLDSLSRSVKKELRAHGVKVYDKRSTSMEEVIAHIRKELIQPANVDAPKPAPPQKSDKAPSAGKKGSDKKVPEPAPHPPVMDPAHARELEELITEVCIESEKLMVAPASGERVARCSDLCKRVGALWRMAENVGSRNLARQAKVLAAFLGRLCEGGQAVAEPALSTVTRAVEVVHSLNCGEPVRENLTEYKAVVIDETAESAAAVSDELFKAGFKPVFFNELQQAVDHLESSPADVIIANLACPELHRLDLPNIRRMPHHKNTPVIYASETAALEAFKDLPTTKMPLAHTTPMLVEELVMKALNDVQNTDLPLEPGPASVAASEVFEPVVATEALFAGPTEDGESASLTAPEEVAPAEVAPVEPAATAQAPDEEVEAPAIFAAAEPAILEASPPRVLDGKRTILFIEDDPFALKIYKKGLKRAGYHVEVAEDGQVALEMLSRFRPDLVVLDLMLPKVNGLEVLEFMRSRSTLKDIPVLVLSNGFMDYLAARAKQAGANRGLSKTECTPTKLVEQVSELLHLHDTVHATRLEDAMQLVPEGGFPEQPDLTAETAIWTRQAGLRKEAPREVAKIRQVGLTYIKCPDPESRLQYLTDLYRRVRFLSAHAALIGFTKIAEVSSALEGLLFEILVKESEPTTSTYQTIAQAVDFIDQLVKRDDTSFPEPRPRPRLIVINDETARNEWFVNALRRGKFDVIGFQDPFDGLRMLKDSSFDLVVLETDIPRMDGFSICEQLRRLPQHASTPVIFVAIGTGFTHRARSIIAGGNDLITQNLSPMELVLRVAMHLLRHQDQVVRRATPAGDAPAVTWSIQEEGEQQESPADVAPDRTGMQPELVAENRGEGLTLGDQFERPRESDQAATGEDPETDLTFDHQQRIPLEESAELQPVHAEVAAEHAEAAEAPASVETANAALETEKTDVPTAELEDLRREFSKQQEALGRYEKERETLMNRIITAENEFHRLEGRVRRRDEKIDKLHRQLQELSSPQPDNQQGRGECPLEPGSGRGDDHPGEQALRESELAKEAAETRCAELEKVLAELRQEHEQVGAKLAAEQQAAAEAGNRLRELQEHLALAEEANRAKEQLESQLKDRAEVEKSLRARLEEAEAAAKESQTAHEQSQAWCDELENELALLTKARDELAAGISNAQADRAQHDQRLQELEERLNQRTQELEHARDDLNERVQVESELRAQLADAAATSESVEAEREKARSRCVELEQQLASVSKTRDELQLQVEKEQEARGEAGGQVKDLQESLEQRGRELDRVRSELQTLADELNASKRECGKHAEAESDLRARLQAAEESVKEKQAAQDQAQARCVELEKDLAALAQRKEQLETIVAKEKQDQADAGKHAKDLEEELRRRTSELEAAESRSQKLAQTESELRAQLEKVSTAINQSQAGEKQAQARCAELERETVDLRAAREEQAAQLSREKRVAAEAIAQVKDLEDRLSRRSIEQERCKAESEKQFNELRRDREKAIEQLTNAQHAGTEMSQRVENLELQLRKGREELEQARVDWEKKAKDHVASEAALRTQLKASSAAAKQGETGGKQLQQRCAKLEKEIAELRQVREELTGQCAKEQKTNSDTAKRVQALEKQLKHRTEELKKAKADWEKQAKALAAAETALRNQLEAAGTAAKQSEAAEKEMRQRCADLEKEVTDLRQQRDKLNAQFANERKANAEVAKRVQELEHQLRNRTEEHTQATADWDKQAKAFASTKTALRNQLEAAGTAAKQSEAAEKEMRQRCSDLEKEVTELRQQRDQLNAQFANERKANAEVAKRVQELEANSERSAQELKRANAECEKHARECAEAETGLRRQLEAGTQREAELKAARQRGAELEQESAGLRQSLGDLERRFKLEQQASAEALKRVGELEQEEQERIKDLQQLNHQLETQSRQAVETASDLRKRLEAATAAAHEFEEGQKQTASRCHELEQQVNALQEQHAQLGAQLAREQQLSAEAMRSGKLLEQQLSERADEMKRTHAELGATRRETSELRVQLEAAEQARNQAQSRLHQLQQDIAVAQVEQQELRDKLVKEQQMAAEGRAQAKELQSQLLGAQAQAEARHTEAEHRIREGAAALARVTADLASERGERQRSEQRVAALNLKLQELHEETRRLLETERVHKQRIVDLDIRVREQRELIDRQTADLEQSQAEQRLTREHLANARNLNIQFRNNLSVLEDTNKNLNATQADLQSRLESALVTLRETESGLQRETTDRQALAATLAGVRHDLDEQTRKRELLELELQDTVRALREREALLQQESTERQGLSEALGRARLEMRDRSQRAELELSRLQQALHSEELERKHQETEIARMRHSFLDSARGTRSLRNTLRRQVREPVDSLYANATLFLQLEVGHEARRVAEAILRDALLVRARLQEPEMPPRENGNGDVNAGEPSIPGDESEEHV